VGCDAVRWQDAPCAELAARQPVRLRALLDASSVELFADGGETVITEQIFPSPEALATRLYADGGSAHFALRAHGLR